MTLFYIALAWLALSAGYCWLRDNGFLREGV